MAERRNEREIEEEERRRRRFGMKREMKWGGKSVDREERKGE